MKQKMPTFILTLIMVFAMLIQPSSAEPQRPQKRPSVVPTAETTVTEIPATARVIQYGERDVATINAKVRYMTLIVLPKNEEILDYTCGDKDFWIINGAQNFAYVKPARPRSRTDLNLVTASGKVYSFVLTEISGVPDAQPDFKVFIRSKDESAVTEGDTPTFVSAREIEECRQEVKTAQEETQRVKEAAQATVDAKVSQFISNVRFPYRFEAGKKPFYVRAMYNDDNFTYIQARPEETPALYELRDGKPNLIAFDYKNGVYVADKILDNGYLAIGKQKLRFVREE